MAVIKCISCLSCSRYPLQLDGNIIKCIRSEYLIPRAFAFYLRVPLFIFYFKPIYLIFRVNLSLSPYRELIGRIRRWTDTVRGKQFKARGGTRTSGTISTTQTRKRPFHQLSLTQYCSIKCCFNKWATLKPQWSKLAILFKLV